MKSEGETKMKNTLKKMISFLITMIMLMNTFPIFAFADGTGEDADPLSAAYSAQLQSGSSVPSESNKYYIIVSTENVIAAYKDISELTAGNAITFTPRSGDTYQLDSTVNHTFQIIRRKDTNTESISDAIKNGYISNDYFDIVQNGSGILGGYNF